jgi:hypothetical protein
VRADQQIDELGAEQSAGRCESCLGGNSEQVFFKCQGL